MEYIDAKTLDSRALNEEIKKKLVDGNTVKIENSHSLHNIGIGINQGGEVIIQGSTGFYTGGFMEDSTLIVEGNTGWYAGDNMMGGELIIKKNAGCNAGTYFNGGTMVIYGGSGSRVGYAMKNGTIIVCGDTGRWAGQMTLGGRLILLGKVGQQVGESMYKGVIYVKEKEIEGNLGGNVYIDALTSEEKKELHDLFIKYDIATEIDALVAIRPSLTGRHTYELFHPMLEPEKAKKYEKVHV